MSEQPLKKNRIGNTSLFVTPICVGTSALGGFPEQYGYDVDEHIAIETITAALGSDYNFIDTSNEYGRNGASEIRIGKAIKAIGGLPDDYIVGTKVDPLPDSKDFSGERVRQSIQESLGRLGLDSLELVYLHDPEKISFESAIADGGPVEALKDLQSEGIVKHLGVAGGPIDLMMDYVNLGIFEAVISHNRFTLIDQSAMPLIELAKKSGVSFVNAAPFGGGMLVRGPTAVPTYCYQPVSEQTLARAQEIESICQHWGLPLASVALQFSVRNPDITSTIVGMSSVERLHQTSRLLSRDIPEACWDELMPVVVRGREGVLQDN